MPMILFFENMLTVLQMPAQFPRQKYRTFLADFNRLYFLWRYNIDLNIGLGFFYFIENSKY